MSAFRAIVQSAEWARRRPLAPLLDTPELRAGTKPEHREAARQIAFALAHDDAGDFMACGAALRLLLNAREAFGLAMAALGAIEERDLRALLDLMWEPGFGGPLTCTSDRTRGKVLEDADWWAEKATRGEREAYAMACLARLAPEDRAALLRAFDEEGT